MTPRPRAGSFREFKYCRCCGGLTIRPDGSKPARVMKAIKPLGCFNRLQHVGDLCMACESNGQPLIHDKWEERNRT